MKTEDVILRTMVEEVAPDRPQEALDLARRIEDPWFRCQALATVADACPERPTKFRLLEEAFSAALEISDPSRVVRVSAWPLKVLCKSGEKARLAFETGRLLHLAEHVDNHRTFSLLLGAVVTGPRYVFRKVLARFKEACLAPLANGERNERGERHLARWVVIVHAIDRSLANELLLSVPSQEQRQRARSDITESGHLDVETLCPWPNLGKWEIGLLPKHERPLGRFLSDSRGTSFHPLKSLEEARSHRDGVVILRGDEGGQIYVVCSAFQVACNEAALERLLADLDAIAWPRNQPDMRRIYFERLPVGSCVPGGMGGGLVAHEPWIHREFREKGLADSILGVLRGTRSTIR